MQVDRSIPQVARARLRLALRAEQAWGSGGLPVIAMSEHADAPSTLPVEIRQEAARPSARSDLFEPPAGEKAAGKPAPGFTEPPPPRERRIELLRSLDETDVQRCNRCELCRGRTRTVFGEGDPGARLMFIGEGPGETEDQTGRPFVGRAGELLNKMIAGMGLRREDVYIANVVKCRPPNNRVPTALEVDTCTPYLHQQIEWIRPDVIVTLGLPATRHLLRTSLSMGQLRGRWSQWRGIKVMPTYHPAYLLRSYTEANRRTVWGDLRQVMAELGLERDSGRPGRQA